MQKNSLKLMAIGLGGFLVILIFIAVLTSGIDSSTKKDYQTAATSFETLNAQIEKTIKDIEKNLADHKDYLEPIALREKWQEQVTTIRNAMAQEKKEIIDEGKKILENDKSEDGARLLAIANKGRNAARLQAKAMLTLAKRVDRYVLYKTKSEDMYKSAASTYGSIKNYNLSTLQTKILRVKGDYPAKGKDLEARLALFPQYQKNAANLWAVIEREFKKDKSQRAYDQFGMSVEGLILVKDNMEKTAKSLSDRAEQPYYSMSKVLGDMRYISKNGKLQYQHKYNVVKVFADGKRDTKDEWQDVDKAFYDKHAKNLGMTLYHKKVGEYDEEGSTYVSPPGYEYVGDSRYGSWRRDNSGNSFWAFYGQYAFMRSMFWGSSSGPLYRNDYDSYRSYRTRGTTYYGKTTSTSTPRYGTNGTFTKTKYASSSYMTRKLASSRSSSSRSYSGSRSYRGSSYSGSRSSGGK